MKSIDRCIEIGGNVNIDFTRIINRGNYLEFIKYDGIREMCVLEMYKPYTLKLKDRVEFNSNISQCYSI